MTTATLPTTPAAACDLRSRGIALCKPLPGDKNPTYEEWNTCSLEGWDFKTGDNIGILGGYLSDGFKPGDLALVILDLDDRDVLAVADDCLPPTGMEEGRPGKPRSHRHYFVDATRVPPAHTAGYSGTAPKTAAAAARDDRFPGPRTRSFTRPGRKEAFRLIGAGGQAACPPSLHPSGERREWVGGEIGEPAVVDYLDLWLACCNLAMTTGCKIPTVDADGEKAATPPTRSGLRVGTPQKVVPVVVRVRPAGPARTRRAARTRPRINWSSMTSGHRATATGPVGWCAAT